MSTRPVRPFPSSAPARTPAHSSDSGKNLRREAAIPRLQHPQRHQPNARVERARTRPIAVPRPLFRPFVQLTLFLMSFSRWSQGFAALSQEGAISSVVTSLPPAPLNLPSALHPAFRRSSRCSASASSAAASAPAASAGRYGPPRKESLSLCLVYEDKSAIDVGNIYITIVIKIIIN